MAETLLRHYVWGMLIFSFFIVGGVSMMGMMKDADPDFATDDSFTRFNESFNQMEEVTATVDSIEGGITDAETDFGAFGVLNALISSAWQSLKLTFTSFSIMNTAYNGLTAIFGVPGWIPAIIISSIVVLIAYTILSAIFQKEI